MGANFDRNVFVNCPFDRDFAPLLEAAIFCVVSFGFTPRLASERLEGGESRLDKIVDLIKASRYSIHDLSRGRASASGEYLRMNMPFELGLDLGYRRSGAQGAEQKKFLIFECDPYDLKRSLSDLAGQDVAFHRNDYELVIKKVRDFFRVEARIQAPGPSRIISDYTTFQGWMVEKKIHEGHSEREAIDLPTQERLDEMKAWIALGRPSAFAPA
ncbi:hypothetical protein [Mycoplana sp. MJR14]|uniref:hypothetical protein n=1 Tax=Mycoplana sp. MJR14 TaxID=3032583 RepID=UPI0023DB3462|nr:hypothetical protein [Mycoplana sp. MJR14]MDF1634776.1 hypothetical protein [Mycoplana sp. MJR14]